MRDICAILNEENVLLVLPTAERSFNSLSLKMKDSVYLGLAGCLSSAERADDKADVVERPLLEDLRSGNYITSLL